MADLVDGGSAEVEGRVRGILAEGLPEADDAVGVRADEPAVLRQRGHVAEGAAGAVRVDVEIAVRIPGEAVPVAAAVVVPGGVVRQGVALGRVPLRVDGRELELDAHIGLELAEERVEVAVQDVDLVLDARDRHVPLRAARVPDDVDDDLHAVGLDRRVVLGGGVREARGAVGGAAGDAALVGDVAVGVVDRRELGAAAPLRCGDGGAVGLPVREGAAVPGDGAVVVLPGLLVEDEGAAGGLRRGGRGGRRGEEAERGGGRDEDGCGEQRGREHAGLRLAEGTRGACRWCGRFPPGESGGSGVRLHLRGGCARGGGEFPKGGEKASSQGRSPEIRGDGADAGRRRESKCKNEEARCRGPVRGREKCPFRAGRRRSSWSGRASGGRVVYALEYGIAGAGLSRRVGIFARSSRAAVGEASEEGGGPTAYAREMRKAAPRRWWAGHLRGARCE